MRWMNLSAREKSIDSEDVTLEFFPRWRYEVLSIMIVRLNPATADYAPACGVKFTSHDRWDMGKSMSYYNAEPILAGRKYIIWFTQKRTLDVFMNLYWTFPLHILSIPDELHLLLRVTDKLLQNVIDERLCKEMQLKVLISPEGSTKGKISHKAC